MRKNALSKKPNFPRRQFMHTSPVTGEDYTVGDGGRHFDLSPTKIKEAVENQARWAEGAQSPYVGVSPELAQVYKARREIKDWYEGLQRAEIALATASTDEAKAEAERVKIHYQTVLAESFALLGEYEEALACLPLSDRVRRQEYQDLLDALTRTDDCACTLENHPYLVTLDRLHKMVYDPATGQMRAVVACNVCNQLSVKGISRELATHREARAQAAQIPEGSMAEIKELLTSRGLTAERYFGPNR